MRLFPGKAMSRKMLHPGTNGGFPTRDNTTVMPDYLLPMETIENFLRYVRNDTDVIAVKIANDALDHGASFDQILTSDRRLCISVTANRDGGYVFYVRYLAGNGGEVVGDSGNWHVDVAPDGKVLSAVLEGRAFYD
jgi:hypothetical protein